MHARKILGLAAISLAALTLAACNSGGSDNSPGTGGYGNPTPSDTAMTTPTSAPTQAPAAADGVGLMTADSSPAPS